MADSLGEIQTAVAGYVLMPTDDEVLDCALQGIRRAIDRLNKRTWTFTLYPQTITFVAGTQEYALDGQFKQPANLALRDSNTINRDRLSYLPWGTFLKEVNYESTGSPCHYSAANPYTYGVLHLDLTPDASFVGQYPTAQLWYYRRISYPVLGGTSLDVVPEATDYIQAFAEGYTADRHAVEKAGAAYSRAERLLDELKRYDNHGQSTDWE